ncbi:MAG: hypothetical protein HeimC2_15020 [Candidatus Heimdallarchaeota archaeon LC_2]|nr:MAG: hypothetical protein HeimC2_15020 [Candidatus Heimdallarchaeota archaeon LC_2]
MLDIVLIVPIVSTLLALAGFVFVLISFRAKPWKMKFWLIVTTFSFIPWAGLTIFMRLANSHDQALWLLRGSFISLQISFYAAYRFHHLMTFRPSDNRIATFGLAALTGFNIALAINPTHLDTLVDASGKYYVDIFGPLLLTTNVILGAWAGYFVFQALNEMDAFALFYDKKGIRNTIPIFLFASVILFAIITLTLWLAQGRSTDTTAFMSIMDLAIVFFGYTYGVNPTSKILAPQRIWSFIIVDINGISVYEHHFSEKEKIGELTLLAMALAASNSTIIANLESKTAINEISMEDRTILIEENDTMLFCLVADHSSIQLQIELKELVKRIVEHKKFRKPRLGEVFGIYSYTDGILKEIFGSKMGSRRA